LLLNGSSTCRKSTLPWSASSLGVVWRWVSHHVTPAAAPATASNTTISTARLIYHLRLPCLVSSLSARMSGRSAGCASRGREELSRGGHGRRLGRRAVGRHAAPANAATAQ